MKRIFFMVLFVGVVGWVVGDMLHSGSAENVLHTAMAEASEAGAAASQKAAVKRAGHGTIVLAANDASSASQLPQSILDARARGATARQRAIEQAIGQVFPKSGDWGMGGPLFPLGQRLVPEPHERPIHTAFLAPIPNPYGGPIPPGGYPFGPGDPTVKPHITHIEQYPPNEPPPPVVPEPAAWLLMITGFAGLGWRRRGALRARFQG